MTNISELRLAVAEALSTLKDPVESASAFTWYPADGLITVICSSVVKRQYDSLAVTVDLVERLQGFAAVGLLRPACEEFLWLKYIWSLERVDAEQLVLLMSRKEIYDSLKSQDDYAGQSVTRKLGLDSYLQTARERSSRHKALVKSIGTRLKWERKVVEAGQFPSLAYIAKSVGEIKLYRFLYHASSRYVHFSPTELLRRAWGKTGRITISSAHFTDYWGSFVMFWGLHLMLRSFSLACRLSGENSKFGSVFDVERLVAAAEKIGAHGQIPIITAEELEWESSLRR